MIRTKHHERTEVLVQFDRILTINRYFFFFSSESPAHSSKDNWLPEDNKGQETKGVNGSLDLKLVLFSFQCDESIS